MTDVILATNWNAWLGALLGIDPLRLSDVGWRWKTRVSIKSMEGKQPILIDTQMW